MAWSDDWLHTSPVDAEHAKKLADKAHRHGTWAGMGAMLFVIAILTMQEILTDSSTLSATSLLVVVAFLSAAVRFHADARYYRTAYDRLASRETRADDPKGWGQPSADRSAGRP